MVESMTGAWCERVVYSLAGGIAKYHLRHNVVVMVVVVAS